jgi:hypothetical protein
VTCAQPAAAFSGGISIYLFSRFQVAEQPTANPISNFLYFLGHYHPIVLPNAWPTDIIKANKLIAVVRNNRIDRSLFLTIVISPVTRAAPARHANPLDAATSRGLLATSGTTMNNTIIAMTKPTDHQPKEVFGRIVIRMFITSFNT